MKWRANGDFAHSASAYELAEQKQLDLVKIAPQAAARFAN